MFCANFGNFYYHNIAMLRCLFSVMDVKLKLILNNTKTYHYQETALCVNWQLSEVCDHIFLTLLWLCRLHWASIARGKRATKEEG